MFISESERLEQLQFESLWARSKNRSWYKFTNIRIPVTRYNEKKKVPKTLLQHSIMSSLIRELTKIVKYFKETIHKECLFRRNDSIFHNG
jgi:hypothetical protein